MGKLLSVIAYFSMDDRENFDYQPASDIKDVENISRELLESGKYQEIVATDDPGHVVLSFQDIMARLKNKDETKPK